MRSFISKGLTKFPERRFEQRMSTVLILCLPFQVVLLGGGILLMGIGGVTPVILVGETFLTGFIIAFLVSRKAQRIISGQIVKLGKFIEPQEV